ncbi:MAG: trigger factor [Anaerolineales bacterium]
MKTEIQNTDDHQVKILVEAEPEELENAKRKAARAIAKRVKIPGFRPGKAPYAVIEKQVGAGTILEDAIEILAQDLYPQAVEDAGIKPYGPGMLENISSVEPVKFEFLVPLQAEVDLHDYQDVRIPYELAAVDEQDVENAINELRGRHAVIETVDRTAEEGDLVRVQLSGERLEPEEEQEAALVNERTLPVVIEKADSDASSEWPFPGFSRELIGMQVGQEKTIEHTFADDSPYESLRTVKAIFKVIVEQVSSRTLPEVDDEFALTVGDYESAEQLHAEIGRELEESQLNAYNNEYDNQVIEAIEAQAELKYPPQMVDRELDDMLHDLEHRLSQQGLDLETYLKINHKSEEELREELRESAEKRLRQSLILFELARAEDIEVAEEDIQNETVATLNAISQSLPEKEMKKLTEKDQIQNLVSNIMADMLVRETIKHIRAVASDNQSVISSDVAEETEGTTDESQEVEGTIDVEAADADTSPSEEMEAQTESELSSEQAEVEEVTPADEEVENIAED